MSFKKLFFVVSIFCLNKKPGLPFTRTTNNTMDQTPLTITNTDNLNIDLSTIEFNIPASQPVNPAPVTITRAILEVKSLEELKEFKTVNKIPGRAPVTNKAKYIDFIMAWVDAGGVPKAKPATTKKKPEPIPEPDSGDEAGPAVEVINIRNLTPAVVKPVIQRVYKTPVNIIHKVDTGITEPGKNSLTPVQAWLKETHNYLYGQENLVGTDAMNDIMSLLFLGIIQDYITNKEEAGKFDLLNLDKYIMGTEPDTHCDKYVKVMKRNAIAFKEFERFIKLEWRPMQDDANSMPKSVLRNENCIIKKYGRFLTIHPQTKDIFTTDNFINCKQESTIFGLIERVKDFIREHVDKLKHADLIGEIYEYFVNQYHKSGTKLGQFFTPRKMMALSLKFKDSQIRANLAKFTVTNPNAPIYIKDPCMGTGGWLISCINTFGTGNKDGKQVFNICPAGNDVSKDTLRMGIMNVMNVNKHMQLEQFSTLNSLTNVIDYWTVETTPQNEGEVSVSVKVPNKKHLIITNPPFGSSGKNDVDTEESTGNGKKVKQRSLEHEYNATKGDGIKCDTCNACTDDKCVDKLCAKCKQCKTCKLNGDYKEYTGTAVKLGLNITAHYNTMPFGTIYNLNDKNMPIQFLELCIHELIDGGMCMIVLPYGELFFSDRYADARAHLMSKVDITDIILYPSGVFTHTGIKSCCLTFIKDSTGTKAIKFYKANRDCNELTEIVTVTRDEINADPIKSWYLNDYLEDVYIRELMCKLDCEWVPFGDVFDLVKGTLQSSKVEEDPKGDGVFITKDSNSDNWMKFKSKYDDEGLFIACVSNGNHTVPINYYKGKYDYNNLLYKCIPNSNFSNINLKYVYYYMIECKKHIEELYQKGACTPSLDDKNFLAKFKIPLPSMDIQRRVVHFYDTIEKNIKFYMNAIEAAENARNANFELSLLLLGTLGGDYQVSNIGTVCKFINGTSHNASYGIEDGLYPFYTSSNKVDKFTNNNDYELGEYLIMGDGGTANVNYNNTGFGVSNHCYVIQIKDEQLIKAKYLYNYIRNNLKGLQLLFRGIGMENISQAQLQSFQVVIPPLEFQEQLIKETECFENDIEFYRRGIKNYTKIRANKFLAVSNKKFYEMFPDGVFGSTLNPKI